MKVLRSDNLTYRLPSLVALAILAVLPSRGIGIDLCPFHYLFGVIYPFCGLVRSMSSILHLEFSQSFMFHPLGGIFLVYLVKCAITNKPGWGWISPGPDRPRWLRVVGRIAVVAAVSSIWIIRI